MREGGEAEDLRAVARSRQPRKQVVWLASRDGLRPGWAAEADSQVGLVERLWHRVWPDSFLSALEAL